MQPDVSTELDMTRRLVIGGARVSSAELVRLRSGQRASHGERIYSTAITLSNTGIHTRHTNSRKQGKISRLRYGPVFGKWQLKVICAVL